MESGIFRQLVSCRLFLGCVFESLSGKELFQRAIALVARKKGGHNLKGLLFGRQLEHKCVVKVVPPDAPDTCVLDLCRPHLEQTYGKYHAVVIEHQVALNPNPAGTDNECERDGNEANEAKAKAEPRRDVSPRKPIASYPQKATAEKLEDRPKSRMVGILKRYFHSFARQ